MNIRLYKGGGKEANKALEKTGKQLEKTAGEVTKGMEQYMERANQMRNAFSKGTQNAAPRYAENVSSQSSKLVPKQRGVELKNTKSPNADSKVSSRVRNAGKRRRLNYETPPDPNPTRLAQPKLSAYGEHVDVTPINRGTLEGLKLVPKGESVGQRIFSRLKDNGVVNFVKKHPTSSLAALNLAGWGLGAGLALSNRQGEEPDTTVDAADTQQTQEDSPGFVIGEDGTPYYYNGSNYATDFIQGSDGNIYSSQGELLGNVGNDARLAGYDDVFDYNAAKAGIDPSQVAAIQQLLGVNVDGKWGARTQAAYQNVLRQMQADDSGIPYTTYNVAQ